jgi:hypothetical protein
MTSDETRLVVQSIPSLVHVSLSPFKSTSQVSFRLSFNFSQSSLYRFMSFASQTYSFSEELP